MVRTNMLKSSALVSETAAPAGSRPNAKTARKNANANAINAALGADQPRAARPRSKQMMGTAAEMASKDGGRPIRAKRAFGA